MSEAHDIVLSLNLTQFSRGITQARIQLDSLAQGARNVATAVQSSLNTISGSNIGQGFTQASVAAKTLAQNITNVNTGLQQSAAIAKTAGQGVATGLSAGIQSAGNKAKATATNIGSQLGQNLSRGLEIGLAHSIGAISVGANPLTSLPHEIIRNISISAFTTLSSILKQTGQSATNAAAGITTLATNLNQASQPAQRASVALASLGQQVSLLQTAFDSIDFTKLGFGVGLLLIGKILNSVGSSLLTFTEGLAEAAGAANLSFTQLNAVIQSTGESMNVNLGTTEAWTKFIKQLSIASGTSQKDLADFGTAFVQIGANAGLSASELQKLVTIAAFTQDRFRNATEQLTNFRQALSGNVRFLANNIPIGTTLNDVTEKYTEILKRQGLTLAEATKQAKETATAKQVLAVLDEASIPFIKTATETTGSFTIELRKLKGTIENLKISFGSGIEAIFAGATKTLRLFIAGLTEIPGPIQTVLSTFLGVSGVVLTVGGSLLKLAGIILIVSTALATLNATLAATTFGNLAGLATSIIGKFITLQAPLTTTGQVFTALGTVIKQFFTNLSGGAGITGVFSNAISKLGAALLSVAKSIFTFGNALAVLKFGGLVFIIEAVIEGFKKFIENGAAAQIAIEALSTITGVFSTSLTELISQLGLSERAWAVFTIGVNTAARAMTGLAFLSGLALLSVKESSSKFLKEQAAAAAKAGDTTLQRALLDKAEEADRAIQRLNNSLDLLEKSNAKLGASTAQSVEILTATTDEMRNLRRETVDTTEVLRTFGEILADKLSEEQIGLIQRAIKSLRSEVDQLKVKNITLISGKAAGEQAAALLKLKDLVEDLNDPKKGGGAKIFTEEELKRITSANQIFDRIAKLNPKLAADLEKQFNQVAPLSATNDALEKQKKLFTEIIGAINNLQDNLIKELATIKLANEFQDKFNNSILGATNNFDDLLRKTQQENEIRRTAIDIEKKIAEIRDKIANGKVEVNDVGTTIRVKLNDQEKAVAQKQLDDLVKTKPAIIQAKIDEASAKRVTDFITEFQKKIQSLNEFFADDTKNLRDQAGLIEKFNEDLAKGTRFAEDQANIRAKDLDLSNKILKVQNDLLDITTELLDETNGLRPEDIARLQILQRQTEAYLERLKAQKESNLEAAKENQNARSQSDILLGIKKQNEALADQLQLLEVRAQLAKDHLIRGEFDKTKEQIDAVTRALEDQYATLIKITREQEANPGIINGDGIQASVDSIHDLEEALKRLNIVSDIKDILQTVPDAFHTAITDGLSEVIQGTKKIKDVLRQFGSDVFKNLSDVFAKKAFDSINNGLDDIAQKIASSDIFKSIGDFFGIDIGKGIGELAKGLKKPQTPQEKLNAAIETNTSETAANTVALKENTAALGGKTGSGGPTTNPNPITPNQLPPIDFEKAAQQVRDGTASLEVITEEESAKLWKDLTGQIQFGLQNVGTEINTTTPGVFQDAGKVIEENITGLSTNISDAASKIFRPVAEIIGESATKLESKISDSANGLSDFATKIFDNLSLPDTASLLTTITKEQDDLANALAKGTSLLGDKFKELGTTVLTDINGVTSNLPITNIFGTLSTDLTSQFKEISAVVDGGVTDLKLTLADGIDGCFGTATQSVKDETNALGTVFNDGFNAFSNRSQGAFVRFFTDIGKIIVDNLSSLRKTITDAFSKITEVFFPDLGKKLSDNLIPSNAGGNNPLTDFSGSEIFDQFGQDFKNGFEKATGVVKENTTSFFDNVKQFFSDSFKSVSDGITDFFKAPAKTLESGISGLGNIFDDGLGTTFDDITQNVSATITDLGSTFQESIGVFSQTATTGFDDLFESLNGLFTDKLQSFSNLFNTSDTSGIGSPIDSFFGSQVSLPSIDIEGITNGIQDGLDNLSQLSIQDFSGYFSDITNEVNSGLGLLSSSSDTGFSGFFSSLSSLLSEGISSLTDGLGGLFGDSGGGSGIFGSILSGIGSLFGFAGGGVIPGSPSKKDNKLLPMATGEGVVTTEAVNFWGGEKFINALNNMQITPDMFAGLQAAGAPAQLAAVNTAPRQIGSGMTKTSSDERPIHVTIIDKSPKLDPASFKMKPEEVVQIFVDGVRKDKVIRSVIRDDLRNGAL